MQLLRYYITLYPPSHTFVCLFGFRFIFCFTSHSTARCHIAMGRLRVEEPVHTSWSRFCTVNHRASASNYQLSNMKHPGRDSNRQPQRLKVSTLTTISLSPPVCLSMCITQTLNRVIFHSRWGLHVPWSFSKMIWICIGKLQLF